MRKTITIATFSFENPAHFVAGSQIIAMVVECCEGLFGAEQLNPAITYRIGTDPLCVGISLDRPEGQAMARVLRHMLKKQLKADVWTEETVTLEAFNLQHCGRRDP